MYGPRSDGFQGRSIRRFVVINELLFKSIEQRSGTWHTLISLQNNVKVHYLLLYTLTFLPVAMVIFWLEGIWQLNDIPESGEFTFYKDATFDFL